MSIRRIVSPVKQIFVVKEVDQMSAGGAVVRYFNKIARVQKWKPVIIACAPGSLIGKKFSGTSGTEHWGSFSISATCVIRENVLEFPLNLIRRSSALQQLYLYFSMFHILFRPP